MRGCFQGSRKALSPPPPPRTERGQHSLAGEGAGEANSDEWKTGEKAWHSVYSILRQKTRHSGTLGIV
jgi:hypothetical protein